MGVISVCKHETIFQQPLNFKKKIEYTVKQKYNDHSQSAGHWYPCQTAFTWLNINSPRYLKFWRCQDVNSNFF